MKSQDLTGMTKRVLYRLHSQRCRSKNQHVVLKTIPRFWTNKIKFWFSFSLSQKMKNVKIFLLAITIKHLEQLTAMDFSYVTGIE